MRSIRSFFRARPNSQRGFALILALVLAVLYFMLIELLMLDASRELGEARRFRSRILALTLAENGAERVARKIAVPGHSEEPVNEADRHGNIIGHMKKTSGMLGEEFEISGQGQSTGQEATHATVRLKGRVVAGRVLISFAQHSQ